MKRWFSSPFPSSAAALLRLLWTATHDDSDLPSWDSPGCPVREPQAESLDLTDYGYTQIGPHTWKRVETFEDWEEVR